ncbi:hypothetical protein OIDMADRAFT_32226 [Oidiodendron maius Zn]|uniref:Zn(2)-C6 fungal-type domain-containing protein n=1 Tax=Oidiodendron maius (strain Zn) TaxID=913774 RepID=A0A0C3H415_OIDMZ|nr:hypothetical protein OIDMADRAFT_32226 [Oidiodendron maius Zn]
MTYKAASTSRSHLPSLLIIIQLFPVEHVQDGHRLFQLSTYLLPLFADDQCIPPSRMSYHRVQTPSGVARTLISNQMEVDSGDSRDGRAAEPRFGNSKRRRRPGSVTLNACLNCKTARAKCDANQPCERCASRLDTSRCIYQVPVRRAKRELVKKIEELEAKEHLTNQILEALTSDMDISPILEQLRMGEPYEKIVKGLYSVTREDVQPPPRMRIWESTYKAASQSTGSIAPTAF